MDDPKPLRSPVKSGLPRLSMIPTPQASRTLPSPSKLPAPSSSHRASGLGLVSPTKSTAPSTAGRRVSGIARPPSAQGYTSLSPTKPISTISSTSRRVSSLGVAPSFSPVKSSTAATPGRRVSGIAAPSVTAPRSSSALAHRSLSPAKTIPTKAPTKPVSRPVAKHTRPQSIQIGAIDHNVADEASDRLGALTSFSSRTAQRGPYGSPTLSSPDSSPLIPNAGERPHNSLYDRTIESLASLPSTPSSRTDRRRSGVFTAASPSITSPMGPPARPASSLAMSKRPVSSSSIASRSSIRPASPVKSIAQPPSTIKGSVRASRPLTTPRRSLSATIPQSTVSSALRGSALHQATPSSRPGTQIRKPAAQPVTARKVSNPRAVEARTPSPVDRNAASTRKPSSSFRQAMEKAKTANVPSQTNGEAQFDVENDPFNRRTNSDSGVLLQRIDVARRDGKLNLNGLGLESVPEEVIHMYDPQVLSEAGIAWHETMHLTSFSADGNGFSVLSDEAFPNISPEEAYQDDNVRASVFLAVEKMNLRGNQLMGLPAGISHLRRLTSLDLSRNELGSSIFDVLPELVTLRELHLGDNNIGGFLPQSIGSLTKLETLDLHNNRILNVPEAIRFMTNLRVLNVSGNQLTGVPMDALECLPIRDLDASNNALVGALFPFGVNGLKHIEELNISNNSLASLAFSENIALPNIRILKVSNNRIVSFPDMSGWTELITLGASGNKIDAIPQGFVSLKHLRNADFSSNDITRIDERIALMDSLESLVVSANPLVDRKFLTMTADAIKRDLRNRAEPPAHSQRTSSSFEDEGVDVRSPKASPANIKLSASGDLDLGGQGLVDRDADGLRVLLGTHNVRSLQLSRNRFTMIPYELSLAQNLRSLDLSMCQLGPSYLTEPLDLRSLQHLQISGNNLGSLQPMVDFLRAPFLRNLDVSNNRLQGPLPVLREVFEHLQELYAADNHIDEVSVASVRGLGTIILSRNDIRSLPAELGLLAFEGLTVLDFSGNAFRSPSNAILDKGTEATLTWLRGKIPNYGGDDECF